MGATCRRYAVRVFPLPFYVVQPEIPRDIPHRPAYPLILFATYFNQKKNIFIYKQ